MLILIMLAEFISLGYIGAFLSGFLSTFTLFLPSPTFVVVAILAATQQFNPLLLGIIGGMGAAIGEMIGYFVGYGIGFGIEKKRKYAKKIKYAKKLFDRFHPDAIIFVFSAAPLLPFDIVGLFCGAIKYDKKRFFLIVSVGKIIKYIVLAYAGFYGIEYIIKIFGL